MSPTRLTALALSAVAIAVSGCGNSSKTTSANAGNTSSPSSSTTVTATSTTGTTGVNSAPTAMSRSELTTSANAICKRLHTQLKNFSTQSALGLDRIYTRAAAAEQASLANLRKLSPPANLNADWNQIMSALGTLAADSIKYAEYTKTKNQAAALRVSESFGSIKIQAGTVATHDGLAECGLVL